MQLQAHHSWNWAEQLQVVKTVFHMTWYCQECQVQNGPKLEYCRQCSQHWERVWKPPKRKSRSKSRYGREKSKEKDKEEKEEEGQWNVFPDRAPWITTTPSKSTSYRIDAMQNSTEKDTAAGKQSFSPFPPSTAEVADLSLTAQDLKKLEHLRGLNDIGVPLTEELTTQLEALQAKEQKMATAKVLSHGHLNRLNKLKSQVEASAKRLKDLDNEWAKFMDATMSKIRQHASMYQACRADLLETFNQRLAELHAIKKEVSAASQSLVDQPLDNATVPDAPLVEDQLLQMQDLVSQEGVVGGLPDQIDLSSDAGMEENEEGAEPVGIGNKRNSPLRKTFRAATSPTKVANQHLKPKAQEAKQKDREVK